MYSSDRLETLDKIVRNYEQNKVLLNVLSEKKGYLLSNCALRIFRHVVQNVAHDLT